MKKLLSVFAFILLTGCIQARQNPRIQQLPIYHILNTDSVRVTSANLKRYKPTMIIYFSPDCSHCQHLMAEIKPHLKELNKMQVVMITFIQQLKPIRDFAKQFGLNTLPNFTLGTEGYTYEMQRYFEIKTTPYIAIYDKNGKLVKAYEKVPGMAELFATVKKV